MQDESGPSRSDPFLTIAEAAEVFNVCKGTVSRMIKRGDLKVVHINRSIRVPRSEIDRIAASAAVRVSPKALAAEGARAIAQGASHVQ